MTHHHDNHDDIFGNGSTIGELETPEECKEREEDFRLRLAAHPEQEGIERRAAAWVQDWMQRLAAEGRAPDEEEVLRMHETRLAVEVAAIDQADEVEWHYVQAERREAAKRALKFGRAVEEAVERTAKALWLHEGYREDTWGGPTCSAHVWRARARVAFEAVLGGTTMTGPAVV